MKKPSQPIAAALAALTAGLALASGLAAGEPKGDQVKLEPKLPKPLFIGTAKPIKIPNLRPIEEKLKPVFIPKGATNVAKGKTVTSSDDFPIIGELEFATDGDKDGSDGYFVELGPGLQWVQIDLEKEHELHALVMWHFHANARAYHDVVVQVADDKDFTKNVRSVFNNDHDNSSGLGVGKDKAYVDSYKGERVALKSEKARFVRLYSAGNTANSMNHYIEVEVYGK